MQAQNPTCWKFPCWRPEAAPWLQGHAKYSASALLMNSWSRSSDNAGCVQICSRQPHCWRADALTLVPLCTAQSVVAEHEMAAAKLWLCAQHNLWRPSTNYQQQIQPCILRQPNPPLHMTYIEPNGAHDAGELDRRAAAAGQRGALGSPCAQPPAPHFWQQLQSPHRCWPCWQLPLPSLLGVWGLPQGPWLPARLLG